MEGINLIIVKYKSKLKKNEAHAFKTIKASIKNFNKFYKMENNFSQNKIIVSKIYEKNDIPNYKGIKELLIQKSSINEIYTKYKKFFDDLKDRYNEEKNEMLIHEMICLLKIEGNIEFINGISLILKSKIYEMDLKSIIFFSKIFKKIIKNGMRYCLININIYQKWTIKTLKKV